MLEHIADFFRFMCDNPEKRLYYVLPIDQHSPYAYQHSSIRDVATICDILDLVQLFTERGWELTSDTRALFKEVAGNTMTFYQHLYDQGTLPTLPEGNIGDLGFFLLALIKFHEVFDVQPKKALMNQIIKWLMERQNPDGSFVIFFDPS